MSLGNETLSEALAAVADELDRISGWLAACPEYAAADTGFFVRLAMENTKIAAVALRQVREGG